MGGEILDENPPWVEDMLAKCKVHQVFKFSKFQQGMVLLHGEKLRVLPHFTTSSATSASSSSASNSLKDIPLLEPKAAYANERTFLHYVKVGVLSWIAAHIMAGSSKNSYMLVLFFAPFLIAYLIAVFAAIFCVRAVNLRNQVTITRSAESLESVIGPSLATGLALALLGCSCVGG